MSQNHNLNNQQNIELISPNSDNLIRSRTHVVKNNYWNERHESILKSLQMNSNKLYKEYQKAHLMYKKKLRLYRIPIIIMSSFTGFLSISNSGYVPASYNKWVSMFVGFVNLMVTVISLIENFKKIDVNMNKTYSAYLEFKKLHDEISMVLNTPQNERENNGYDMANTFFARYEMYLNDAPILSKAIHDYLDENSPDNTTRTINPSTSYSKFRDNETSGSLLGNDELYTEGEYDILADELEAQKRELCKLKQKDRRINQEGQNVKENTKKTSSILSWFGFGSEKVEESDTIKNNLTTLKSSVRNLGRTNSFDENFDKNVFIKKKQNMHKKSIDMGKKASKTIQKNSEKIENEVQGEINSNMNRLEEEMKKLDELELKPTRLPILRNIKISEDLDNSSSKHDSKDSDFIQIIGYEEYNYSEK